MAAVQGVSPKSAPSRRSVPANFSVAHRKFQIFKRLLQSLIEDFFRNVTELRLRIVHVEDIDGLELKVAATAFNLVGEIARIHTVRSPDDFPGRSDAAGNVF